MIRCALRAAVFSVLATRLGASTAATVAVDAGVVQRVINRDLQIGQNFDIWKDLAKVQSYQTQLVAAGIKRFRYPGGTLADIFHWNSNGSYNAAGIWQPSSTVFTAPGFRCDLRHRGTTDRGSSAGSFPSKLTDGSTATEWRSNTLSAHGINPWFYIDLGSAQNVNKLTLDWGAEYATGYRIQNYTGGSGSPYQDSGFNWNTLLTVAGGTGGLDTRTFASTNARFFRVELLTSSASGYAVKEAELYFNLTLRSSHSTNPNTQSLCVASPTSLANDANATGVYLGFEDYMSFINAYPGGATPVITVNLGTGTPEEAAAWVYYANIVRNYGIRHWELGNEVEGVQMPGGPFNGYFYAERLKAFSAAMRAVDPTILIEGPVLAWLESPSHLYDSSTFTTAMFSRLQSTSSLNVLDILNFHDYPNWANNNAATSLATFRNWATSKNAYIQNINSTFYPGSPRPVHLSESNSGDATSFTVKLTNGLWAASYYPEFMKAWGDTGACSYWFVAGDMYQGGDGTWGDHGMLEGRNNLSIPAAARGQGRADYWAAWLMKTKWMAAGVANDMVQTTSTQANLGAWTLKRGDGHLALLLVNIDPAVTYSANIQLTGYAPNATGTITTFAGAATAPWYTANYVWLENGYNSYSTSDITPSSQSYSGISTNFSQDIPPYSITVFDLTNSNATFTPTPVISPTPSSTPVTYYVWDDFEQNQAIQVWQGWTWGTATQGPLALNAGCAEAGSYGFSAPLSTGTNGGGGFILGSPYGTEPLDAGWLPHRQYRDLSSALAVEIWLRSSSTALELKLQMDESALNGADSETWVAAGNVGQYVAAPNVWQKFTFPLSGFVRTAGAGNNAADWEGVKQMQVTFWGVNQNGVTLCVDEIRFLLTLPPSPTPSSTRSPTRTVSASPSPTPSRSATQSPSPSASPTPSGTPSSTRTHSLTISPTQSSTPTATPSTSATSSPTVTRTGTATSSHSQTASPSATPTSTFSISSTFSQTPSPSPTGSGTASPSATPPFTATVTFTVSESFTVSPTLSISPTPSASPSPSPSLSVSPTQSGTLTLTESPTLTSSFSETPSESASPTASATSTVSVSLTPSATQSATLTISQSQTHTPSSTRTPTATASASPTQSVSATQSATVSVSVSPTLTRSPALSFTGTPTLALGASATATPTNTLTASPTAMVTGPTATPTRKGKKGSPKPLALLAVPNPQGGVSVSLYVNFESDADSAVVEIFTKAMTQVASHEVRGPFLAGWNALNCPATGLANGLFYVRISGRLDSGEQVTGTVAKIYRLE